MLKWWISLSLRKKRSGRLSDFEVQQQDAAYIKVIQINRTAYNSQSLCSMYPQRQGGETVPKGIMRKIVGLIAFFIAVGMFIMLVIHNRLIGLIIIALLLFVGYNCFCGD